MRTRFVAIAIATWFCWGYSVIQPGAAAQQQHAQRGPSTAEERVRAVKIAHDLEGDPLAKDAKDNREWVIQWIVDIPDITVNVCEEYFGKLTKPMPPHANEIVNQMVISSAAFMIEHPDKVKNDEQAVATAGIAGCVESVSVYPQAGA